MSGPPSVASATPQEQLRSYLDRLMRMIPGEVIGLYLVGSGFIPLGYKVIAKRKLSANSITFLTPNIFRASF